jgi:hypothetical protein
VLEAAYRKDNDRIPTPRASVALTLAEKGFVDDQIICSMIEAANTTGIELQWTDEYSLVVKNVEGKIEFEFDFGNGPKRDHPAAVEQIGSSHYRVSTGCHILFPPGFNGLVLSHPRAFDYIPQGTYSDLPTIVPSLWEMDWWPSNLSVLCHIPYPGQEHIFYAGEPCCQIVPVPRGDIPVLRLTDDEIKTCKEREQFLKDKGFTYESASPEIKKLGWFGFIKKYSGETSG